ncbi:ankyrin-3 [Plakobranchus ocellatus]|uniref:Ankyrin-3 n=1 Tax=Plakobranchus ocellatus TaxID=259542 RepID=A0AAV4D864_9GAST|nr:ankyrin-3 [Plakobranchus ocellatus]
MLYNKRVTNLWYLLFNIRDPPPSPGQKLLEAIKSGNMKAVDDLLNDHQKDEHKQISQDHLNAALLEACRAGWKFFVHKLVRSGATVCSEDNKNCTTALHIVAQHGFLDIVNFLLHKGADVNAVDENLNTALILAINPASCTEILNILLAHGAEVDAQNSEGMTALMKAVEARDINAIRILILARADDKKRNRKGQTSTDIAMDSGISEVFKFIKYRKSEKSRLGFFKSALSKAVSENNIEAVKILVDCVHRDIKFMSKCNTDYERGNRATLDDLVSSMCVAARRPKKPDMDKLEIAQDLLESLSYEGNKSKLDVTSLLKKATQNGLYELVEILCKYEDFERVSGTSDHPALVIAAEKGWANILKLLLSFAPVPTDRRYGKNSALFSALKNNHIDCANILLQKRSFSNTYLSSIAGNLITQGLHQALDHLVFHPNDPEFTQSLLSQAVEHGRVESVQVLINRGADVNARHDGGKVALVLALECLEGSQLFKMATFLVERGAHVNRSLPDKSPLVCAAYKDPEIVRYLLEKGADINEVGDEMGNTLLMTAILPRGILRNVFDRFDLIQFLLDFGADPNRVNSKGDTALHIAVAEQKLDVVSKLLDAGADLEVPDSGGRTPLLMADMINKQGKDGLTPLMLAAQNADIDVMEIFLELGADPNIVNQTREEACTALSIVLDCIDKPRALTCVEELIKHNGLASMPGRCYLALLKMIVRDERQMVQLMVTRGMAPLCVDVQGTDFSALILGENESLKHSLSPLAAALLSDRLAIAQFLVNNWFLTPVDVVGSPLLQELRRELKNEPRRPIFLHANTWNTRRSLDLSYKAARLSFMDEHLSQPMSLVKLSFVAVSAALGEPAGREERVRNTPLPAILQDKLLFRHEIFPMEMP